MFLTAISILGYISSSSSGTLYMATGGGWCRVGCEGEVWEIPCLQWKCSSVRVFLAAILILLLARGICRLLLPVASPSWPVTDGGGDQFVGVAY